MRRRFSARPAEGRRVALVAGIHGDAPEGMAVAHQVAAFLEANEGRLRGTVDIYPCVNPLAAHHGARLWPFFDVDLDRLFPGRADGHPPDRVADALTRNVAGADQVIEIRGPRPGFREVLIAHVRRRDPDAAALALRANVAAVWSRVPGPNAPGTFANQHPGAVVLGGGSRGVLSPGVGQRLADGVLNMLAALGVLDGAPALSDEVPLSVGADQMRTLRTDQGGLFLPGAPLWAELAADAVIGAVIDPSTGEVREQIRAPVAGRLASVLAHPVVFPGSAVARLVVA